MSERYDDDFLIWTERQAELLRRVAAGDAVNEAPDWTHIVEEIESLGKSDRREVRNRIATILLHLIKLQASPAAEPRNGWIDTVLEQRSRLHGVLNDSPSLRQAVGVMIAEETKQARVRALLGLSAHGEDAQGEDARVDLDQIAFTEEQVLGPWLP